MLASSKSGREEVANWCWQSEVRSSSLAQIFGSRRKLPDEDHHGVQAASGSAKDSIIQHILPHPYVVA